MENIAISATGAVAFCKVGITYHDATKFYSLNVLENDKLKTLIPAALPEIQSLAFIHVAGREQLLINHESYLSLFDVELRTERKLGRLEIPTIFSNVPRNDKVLHFKATRTEIEVWQLQITPTTCNDSLKTTLALPQGLSSMYDICETGDYFIISGRKGSTSFFLRGVKSTDGRVIWETLHTHEPSGLRPGPQGTVFLLNQWQPIYQVAIGNGSILRQLHLLPSSLLPYRMYTRDDTLYVVQQDLSKKCFMINKYSYTTEPFTLSSAPSSQIKNMEYCIADWICQYYSA